MSDAIQQRSLREIVAERIHGMIMEGMLQPGERLIEEHLAKQCGVSRNPVREAIRLLEGTGLIEVIPRKGAHVSRIDAGEKREILEVRLVIEPFSAELASKRRTDEDVARLTECIDRGLAATEAGDKIRAAAWHRDFHVALGQAAHNPWIERALFPLRQRTELMVLQEGRGAFIWADHRDILDAVTKRNTRQAGDLMRQHMALALDHLESSGS